MSATSKAANAARSDQFMARVRIILSQCAAECINNDNQAVAAYARNIINGRANWVLAAYMVASNPTIMAAIEANEPQTEDYGVTDDMLMEAIFPTVLESGLLYVLAVGSFT